MPRLFFLSVMLVACSPLEFPLRFQSMNGVAGQDSNLTDVRVELVQGPALPMAKLLSSSIASGLVERGITTSLEPGDASRFVLKGLVKANWDDRKVPFVMLIYLGVLLRILGDNENEVMFGWGSVTSMTSCSIGGRLKYYRFVNLEVGCWILLTWGPLKSFQTGPVNAAAW